MAKCNNLRSLVLKGSSPFGHVDARVIASTQMDTNIGTIVVTT